MIECENAPVSVQLARSTEQVPHSRIRELANLAFGMEGVLRLYFGESNQRTPDYTKNAGMLSLREAIAAQYQRLQNVTLDPRREIVVTASGVQALSVAIRCVLDPGDEALVLTPAWPNGASIVAMANARAVEVPQPLIAGR